MEREAEPGPALPTSRAGLLGHPDPGVPRLPLHDLMGRLIHRLDGVATTQERLHGLLDAVVGIGSDLALPGVLERIVTAASELAGASYGALGVLGPDRRLAEFVTYGVSPDQRAAIGAAPRGHGILGVLIEQPRPLRLRSISDAPDAYGFPPHHPRLGSFLGVPIRIRDEVYGNLYLADKRGAEEFGDEDEEIVVALAAAAGVAVDNARRYEQAGRRQRWLEAAAEVTAVLLGEGDRRSALGLVARRARELAAAERTTISLRDPATGRLEVVVSDGRPSDAPAVDAHAEAAEVLRTGTPLIVGAAAPPGRNGVYGADHQPGADAAQTLLVPLAAGEEVLGVLAVSSRLGAPGPFTELDVALVGGYAGQAGLALDRARAQRDRQLLAVLEERDRIARDLHDLVIQRLFATGLSLRRVARMSADRPAVLDRVQGVVDDLDETIREIRGVILLLHDETGDRGRRGDELPAAVRSVLAEYAEVLGFPAELTLRGPLEGGVPPSVREDLLAVLREALSNAARHAAAGRVEVRLEVGAGAGGQLRLEVADDGVGVGEGDNRPRREGGLRTMRERARHLGGSARVGPRPGGGTLVEWTVPVPGRGLPG